MENTQKTVRLPSGELALATRVTPMERAHIRCWNCKTHLVYEKDAETVKCSICNSLNGTTNHPALNQFVVFRCNSCSALLKAPAMHPTVSCARCGSISIISRNRREV